MKKLFIIVAVIALSLTLSSCGETDVFDTSQAVNVYTRDTESGTREAFFKGIDFDDAAENDALLVSDKTVVSGNGDMINKVNADEYGLGYISLSSLNDSGLIGLSFEGIVASEENVLNDSYGLKRPFNYMTRTSGDYSSIEAEEIIEAMVAYMGTLEGKAIIRENGGIVEVSSSDVSWDAISGDYSICTVDNSSIDVVIGGSTSVENIAKAITADFKGKCGDFVPQHNHLGSSAAYKGTQKESDKDAASTYLDLGFASRNFKETETGAEGSFNQICWDAVVAVVNEANNTITNISGVQLKNIYDKDGSISTWSDLIE